jgi:hypothetical protein
MKPPRFPTVFEALVNAFACQQLSLEVGLELLNRLADVCGVKRGPAGHARYGFPAPRDVARLPPATYRALGFSRHKVRALLTLARAIERRDIDVETVSRGDDAAVCARLLSLRGMGRWSAEYVMLRVSAVSMSSRETTWALRRDSLAGSVARLPWTTPACARPSRHGSPAPAWCTSTYCSTACRRVARWNEWRDDGVAGCSMSDARAQDEGGFAGGRSKDPSPATESPDRRGHMHRSKRVMPDDDARALLRAQKVAHVRTVGERGWPYVVPLIYIYEGGDRLYVHTGNHGGHFERNLRSHPAVCVEVAEMGPVHRGHPFACNSALAYTSVIVFGPRTTSSRTQRG